MTRVPHLANVSPSVPRTEYALLCVWPASY